MDFGVVAVLGDESRRGRFGDASDHGPLVFAGTAGTVTVGSVATAEGLTFATTGYLLSDGTLGLTGASAAANALTVETGTTTIASSVTAANGFSKAGPGGTCSRATTTPRRSRSTAAASA